MFDSIVKKILVEVTLLLLFEHGCMRIQYLELWQPSCVDEAIVREWQQLFVNDRGEKYTAHCHWWLNGVAKL